MQIIKIKQDDFILVCFGVLVYATVIGFLSDYTNLVYTQSYSTTFLSGLVLQLMVFPTFKLKYFIAAKFKNITFKYSKFVMLLLIWCVMFFSKFIFLEVLDIIFGKYLSFSGFIALIIVIIASTIVTTAFEFIYKKLE